MMISSVLAQTTELKKLIEEHPTYPIAVLASEEANSGDYSWMYCSYIRFRVGEILDCDQPVNDEIIFNDRDDFEEQLEEWLWDKMCDDISHNGMYDDREPTEKEFQKALDKEKAKYEEYWTDCILIYAGN